MTKPWRWRRPRLALFLALTVLVAALPAQLRAPALPELDAQLEPLRSQFNADAGKVRFILLLDAT